MSHQINRILTDNQITEILNTIFINRPIKILRSLSATGHHKTSVPWVYYVNEITQESMASFISFKDLLQNFWVWLESVNLFALAFFQRLAISEIIYRNFINNGDHVYHKNLGWAKIINSERSEKLNMPRFWIELESDSRIEIVEPCYLEIF